MIFAFLLTSLISHSQQPWFRCICTEKYCHTAYDIQLYLQENIQSIFLFLRAKTESDYLSLWIKRNMSLFFCNKNTKCVFLSLSLSLYLSPKTKSLFLWRSNIIYVHQIIYHKNDKCHLFWASNKIYVHQIIDQENNKCHLLGPCIKIWPQSLLRKR